MCCHTTHVSLNLQSYIFLDKSGRCPIPIERFCADQKDDCVSDYECPGYSKCCNDGCRKKCSSPSWGLYRIYFFSSDFWHILKLNNLNLNLISGMKILNASALIGLFNSTRDHCGKPELNIWLDVAVSVHFCAILRTIWRHVSPPPPLSTTALSHLPKNNIDELASLPRIPFIASCLV